MSDQNPGEAAETEAKPTENTEASEPKPSETVDFWKQKAREQEKRAKENAEARRRLDEIETANKSEMEKANDRVSVAEQERDEAKAALLRFQVAAKNGITDPDDIDLFLTGTDEETLTRQALRLAARTAEANQPRSPRPDPNQGRSNQGTSSTADQFAAALGDALNH